MTQPSFPSLPIGTIPPPVFNQPIIDRSTGMATTAFQDYQQQLWAQVIDIAQALIDFTNQPKQKDSSQAAVTWLPDFGGGAAYATQFGYYAYVGPLIVALFNVVCSSIGSPAGNAVLNGLPVAASPAADVQGGWISSFGEITMAGGRTQLGCQVAPGASAVSFYEITGAAPVSALALPASALGAATQIAGGVAYFY